MMVKYMEIRVIGVDDSKKIPILSEDSEEDTGIATIDQTKVKRPKKFKVLLHNDDYTTMEFVINVLQTVFMKSSDEAKKIMLQVHNDGVGVCGVYTHEIAETKQAAVIRIAKDRGHPLKCTIEEE